MSHPLLVLALAVILGGVGARLFKMLRIPQVVAFVLIGTLLGPSALNLIRPEMVGRLAPITYIALGIIGFSIGGELRLDVFRKHGGKSLFILVAEGTMAFLLVALAVGLFTRNWALALLLGAIASATAPAATVGVLWEYKSMGVLTTMVLVIVALDDGLALLLYGFASAIAKVLLDGGSLSWGAAVGRPLLEIFGAVLLGSAVAVALWQALRYVRESDLVLGLALGSILLVVGASEVLGVSLILAAMFLGCTFVNLPRSQAPEVFAAVKRFAPPLYVLFFVLAGAHLRLGAMQQWMWIAAALYVIARTAGKFAGAYLGARLTGAAGPIRKYLGMCLFSQAGVAIGLAVLSAHSFERHPEIAAILVGVVTTTTFLLEIIGPPFVKLGITKAGEVGRDVTEDDLLATHRVSDLMNPNPVTVRAGEPLDHVLDMAAASEVPVIPVVDGAGALQGVIRFIDLRTMLNSQSLGPLVLALDVMEAAPVAASPAEPLKQALEIMRGRDLEFLPVTDGAGTSGRLVGLLDRRRIQKRIADEVIRRHKEALAV